MFFFSIFHYCISDEYNKYNSNIDFSPLRHIICIGIFVFDLLASESLSLFIYDLKFFV